MNSLGIGSSGKSFSLYPQNHNLLNSVKSIKGYKNNKTKDIKSQKVYDNFANEIKKLRNRNIAPSEPNTSISENNNTYSSSMNNQSDNNIESPEVNWGEVFGNVCKQRLYGKFMELKKIFINDPTFSNQLICYIDEDCARYLVENTKDKILTLRMRLNSIITNDIKNNKTFNMSKSQQLNKALELIKQLEQMGPSNNLLIALNPKQVDYLHNSYLKSKKMFWPNGNDGITWLTKL